MKKITEKLHLIQTELKAPKGQYNSFGKYSYRSCEDITEGVKPLLIKTKTILTLSDEIVQVGDRYYVKATAKLSDGEEEIEVSGFAREEENKKGMDGSQVTGASSSYARKYALNGLFAIDDTKDSDTANDGDKPNTKEEKTTEYKTTNTSTKTTDKNEKATKEQVTELKALAKRAGVSDEKMFEKYTNFIYKTPFISVYNKAKTDLEDYIKKNNK